MDSRYFRSKLKLSSHINSNSLVSLFFLLKLKKSGWT